MSDIERGREIERDGDDLISLTNCWRDVGVCFLFSSAVYFERERILLKKREKVKFECEK